MKTLILLLTLLVVGCANPEPNETVVETEVYRSVIVIEDCEYIQTRSRTYGWWYVYSLTHKGNCKNVEHKK